MAIFGFGQQDPYAEATQAAQDRQTAFAGIKDNLPALGLIAGLSMLARNNGSRSVGQLVGQAGADALNAYGTWQKLEDARQRQKMLDEERKEEREYGRTQDAFRNDMAERKLAMEQAKMAQDMQLARQRMGLAYAGLAAQRQAQALAAADKAAQEEYAKTHRMGADGNPYVMRTGEDGKTFWELDKENMIIGPNGEVLGVKTPDPAKFTDVKGLAQQWRDESENYTSLAQNTRKMMTAARAGTGAGDITLLYSYMKAMDPRSVVREGEFATAQNAGGVDQKIRSLYNQVINGQRLTPEQRREFVRISNNLLKDEMPAQAKRNARFGNWAKTYNMDPSLIYEDPYAGVSAEVDEWLNSPLSGSGTRTGAPAMGGANIPGVTPRGGPAGRAAPSASALPPGFRIVR